VGGGYAVKKNVKIFFLIFSFSMLLWAGWTQERNDCPKGEKSVYAFLPPPSSSFREMNIAGLNGDWNLL